MDYPIHLKLAGRGVLIAGAGKVAERRVKTLLAAAAKVRVIAPEATDYLRAAAARGEISWEQRPFAAADLDMMPRPVFLIAATPDFSFNAEIAAAAKARHILVNMAAPPLEAGDFLVPGHICAGDILFSLATGGRSPALARLLRQTIESDVVAPFAAFLPRLAPLRAAAQEIVPAGMREDFWRRVLDRELAALIISQQYDKAEAIVKDALDNVRP